MSYPEPVSYSSLKDLKKGKGHGGGGVPPPPPSSYAQFYDVEPAQTSSWRQQNPAPSRPVAVNPTKYVDPSKRKEGQDAPTYHRKVAEGDGKDQQPAQGGVWNNVTNTASQGWDNVNDANRRDQVSALDSRGQLC